MRAWFLGSKGFGLSVAQILVASSVDVSWTLVHPDDRADSRSALPSFEAFAQKIGAKFTVTDQPEVLQTLFSESGAEIAVVCGWYRLLAQQFIERFPLGVFGLHNSLLPKYRGGAPLVWSIFEGEPIIGSTFFKIGRGMDDGPIALQIKVTNNHEDHIGSLLGKIETQLLAQMGPVFANLMHGKAALQAQDESQATYCGLRRPCDGEIDWSWTAQRVHNFVRAQSDPYPGAFTWNEVKRISVLSGRPDTRRFFGTPGQVLERSSNGVVIACGESTAFIVQRTRIGNQGISPHHALTSTTNRLRQKALGQSV